jgi:exosortase/archaeosortase family protein
LLALSLPLVSTLQFYLGYPLRLPTTQLSALLLRLCGIHVHANGTTLLWAGERVIVDAPCSGIHMAWAGLFVAATLACWRRLSSRDTLRLFRWTGALVFVANVFRSTALFFLGAGIWRLPAFAHEGIGLLVFAATVLLIYFGAMRQKVSPLCTR